MATIFQTLKFKYSVCTKLKYTYNMQPLKIIVIGPIRVIFRLYNLYVITVLLYTNLLHWLFHILYVKVVLNRICNQYVYL